MMNKTVAETIHDISLNHLNNGGLIFGQCLSAVGRINGTIPDHPNIVELPMTDVSGAGIAVGAALSARRPIFVMRFQDFVALNGSPILNYAAKVKQMHGIICPIFIRALASEGLGPVHSGVFHNIFMHYPGISVWSPMTPLEYRAAWESFMINYGPYYISEHRDSFQSRSELLNVTCNKPDIVIYGISAARFEVVKASNMLKSEGIECSICHVFKLKPLHRDMMEDQLKSAGLGLVVDTGFEICGASRDIAYQLMESTGASVKALGVSDSSKLFRSDTQNRYPSAQKIYDKVKEMLLGVDTPIYGKDTP